MLKISFLLALSLCVVYYFFNSSKKLEELAPEKNFIAYKNLDIKKKKELINKVDFKQIVELHNGSKNMRNLYAEKQSNSQQIKNRYIQQLLDTNTNLEQLEKLRLEFFLHANENQLSLNYLHTLPVYYLIVVIHDGIPLFQENLTPEELSLTVSKYSRDEIIQQLQELRYTGQLKDALDDF